MRAWFCRHKWELVSEGTLPSAFELMVQAGYTVQHVQPIPYYAKTHVTVVKCDGCGSLQKLEAKNP